MSRSPRLQAHAARAGFDEALAALTADELRTFVRDALERLDDGPRGVREDLLVQRASRSPSGWKPAAPSPALVGKARSFMAAARRVAHADPSDIDDLLRQASTASLAGDHVSARAVFEAVFEPVLHGELDLGQDELVEEVLSVSIGECVRRYLASVYLTTPLGERPDAVLAAINVTSGLSFIKDPIEEIARALGGDVPEVAAFLPLWTARLERDVKQTSSDWESDPERWLRAAIGRRDGVAGLARLARTTKRAEAGRAWCDALVQNGDWSGALVAYEECATLAEDDCSRGVFLDGTALAAQVLGRKDLLKKLEAAWVGAPSLLRLARWLAHGAPSAVTLRKRIAMALVTNPSMSPRLLGFLHLLSVDVTAAARHLSIAPGLGWSRGDHAGHVLFPSFAWLLGAEAAGPAGGDIAAILRSPLPSAEEFGLDKAELTVPRLVRPTLIDLLERSEVARRLTSDNRKAMLEAMKAAASRRTDRVLGEKRRRHYGHAAALVACCAKLESSVGQGNTTWVTELRTRTSRFPSFQRALRDALAKIRQAEH